MGGDTPASAPAPIDWRSVADGIAEASEITRAMLATLGQCECQLLRSLESVGSCDIDRREVRGLLSQVRAVLRSGGQLVDRLHADWHTAATRAGLERQCER